MVVDKRGETRWGDAVNVMGVVRDLGRKRRDLVVRVEVVSPSGGRDGVSDLGYRELCVVASCHGLASGSVLGGINSEIAFWKCV